MYDLVIIGSGPAGLSAAVYAKRACLDVVVLEKEPMGGGQMIYTQEVDNYLGLPETNGFDLAQKFEQHAKALEVPFISDEVDNVEKNTDGTWKITGASGTVYETKTVLLATGAGTGFTVRGNCAAGFTERLWETERENRRKQHSRTICGRGRQVLGRRGWPDRCPRSYRDRGGNPGTHPGWNPFCDMCGKPKRGGAIKTAVQSF